MIELIGTAPKNRLSGIPELLTIAEAAEALRVSYSSAYRMVRSGELPVFRAPRNPRTIRIRKEVIRDYLARYESELPAA